MFYQRGMNKPFHYTAPCLLSLFGEGKRRVSQNSELFVRSNDFGTEFDFAVFPIEIATKSLNFSNEVTTKSRNQSNIIDPSAFPHFFVFLKFFLYGTVAQVRC